MCSLQGTTDRPPAAQCKVLPARQPSQQSSPVGEAAHAARLPSWRGGEAGQPARQQKAARQPRQRGMLWVEAQDVVEFLHERLLSVLRLARVAEQPQEEFECQLHLGKVTEDRKKGRIGDRVDMRGGHGTTWPSVAQLRPRVKCTWSSMCVHPLRE